MDFSKSQEARATPTFFLFIIYAEGVESGIPQGLHLKFVFILHNAFFFSGFNLLIAFASPVFCSRWCNTRLDTDKAVS